jgi:hypothetical protein
MPSASPLSLADRDHPGTGGVGCAALHHRPPSLTPIPAYARPATTVPGSTVRGGRVGPGADHAWPFRVRAAELLTVRGSWRRPCDLSTTTLATTGHHHRHHHSHRWIINATERDGRGHRAPGHRQESMTRPCYIDRAACCCPPIQTCGHHSGHTGLLSLMRAHRLDTIRAVSTICNEARNGASEDCLKWLRLSVRLECPLCGRP